MFLPSHEVLPSGHSVIEAAPEESAGESTAQTGVVCLRCLCLDSEYVTWSFIGLYLSYSGSWWASISSSVKKVAEGVAKDLDELNESFQKLLEESDEEETEEITARKPESQRRAPAEAPNPESPKTAAHRNEILSRLEGEDTELDAGLKVC